MTNPGPVDPETLFSASIESWKRKLLDLSKRNRALHFRPTRVSTITMVDEHPAEVFRQLYMRERPMRFKAAPEASLNDTPAETAGSVAVEVLPRLAEEDETVSLDFVPYDSFILDERHTDEWLQTTSSPEALDKSLRRLDEQARLSIEEQGVNTLFLALGMLHYAETGEPKQIFKAPLLLLPVELSRKSARSGYVLRATEDDPLVNPALIEHLRRSYGITLPEIPDSGVIPDDYDLQSLLKAANAAVALQKDWAVKTDIHLALFSFQKFVMYKDLEAQQGAVRQHRLLRQLVTRSGEAVIGLPEEIRTLELDRDYPPESTFQVVDADSSQLRVIAASARGHDLVIEGPPGTGKSQTITNLIAQALSSGRSVLFVAEKMAALQVVHNRLSRVGLGEFCLELHSAKANKRAVMKELAAALDASLHKVVPTHASAQRLPQVRAMLSEYVQAVHAPYGDLGLSPFQVYGELGRVLGASRWSWSGPPAESATPEQLETSVRQLQDLAAVAGEVGIPDRHPWRDTTRTFYSQHDLERVQGIGEDVSGRLAELQRRADAVEAGLQFPPVRTFADIETAAGIAAVLARSPGAPLDVLAGEGWNAPPPEALSLLERGRSLQQLERFAEERFTPAALEQEHVEDIGYVERKSQGLLSFLAFLDARQRAIRKRWQAYRLTSYQGSLVEQANDMKQVDRLRREREELARLEPTARALFGGLWQGGLSDWSLLEDYVRWVVELRTLCVRYSLTGRALERATQTRPDVSEVAALSEAAVAAGRALDAFRTEVGWPADLLKDAPISEITGRVEDILQNLPLGPRWAAFEGARQTAEGGFAREILPRALNGAIPFAELAPVFLRAFYLQWLSAAVRSRTPLERFHTMTHEERVAEFRNLDQQVLLENRSALVARLRDQTQSRLLRPEAASSLPFLLREMARQRGLSPLRRTLRKAGAALRAIKPCFLMSPLTVAQYFDGAEIDGAEAAFDLVIFDEASQLPTEDSVGAILRGRQLVVVGDPKQLPPTNFFASTWGEVVPLTEDGTPLYEDSESVLEELLGAGLATSRLQWHYRSAHESLISFSNATFYDASLLTFPSVETASDSQGIRFEYVARGVYEGKGLNPVEARRVADEVVDFAREQLTRRNRGERPLSLGVGTFNQRQQIAIQDELEQRRRDEPKLEPFFDRGLPEPFFIKNLENIQGDERDVVFLSVTYGRGADGKLRHNFGPVNGQNGWRRLNVLTTRARHHMRVFASMRGDEINATAAASPGPRLLRDFLLYAERGRLEGPRVEMGDETQTPFERDVFLELSRRGIRLIPRVGVAGYRIDFGVLDDAVPGRYLCGIECDGIDYRDAETARDRDRLRQQVLESRGWTLLRVWSTDWFKDRSGQIDRLLRRIEETRALGIQEVEAEHLARERAAAEAAVRAAEELEAARREATAIAASTAVKTYERPTATLYTFSPGEGRFAGRDILEAPLSQIVSAVTEIIEHESPIHTLDLFTRVAGRWGSRPGSRIQDRILEACASAERGGMIVRRGDFYWQPDRPCPLRSRTGTRTSASRIAPEEYTAAILAILATGFGFSRPQLVQEIRSVLGFSRTGALLDEAIGAVIEDLVRNGTLGEGSNGIRPRGSLGETSFDP